MSTLRLTHRPSASVGMNLRLLCRVCISVPARSCGQALLVVRRASASVSCRRLPAGQGGQSIGNSTSSSPVFRRKRAVFLVVGTDAGPKPIVARFLDLERPQGDAARLSCVRMLLPHAPPAGGRCVLDHSHARQDQPRRGLPIRRLAAAHGRAFDRMRAEADRPRPGGPLRPRPSISSTP